jgi:hypothetical protein
MKHEVALKWTDNRGAQQLYRNVAVHYLDPGRPKVKQRAMIIAGDGVSLIGTVVKRIRGSKDIVLCYDDDTDIEGIIPESDLCRLADPEVLRISEMP